MTEQWRHVDGYEGLYEVSNFGNVASLNYKKTGKRRLMSPGKDTDGYLFVGLTNKKETKQFKVHRLVSIAFLPNPENKPFIDHIDGNPSNNHVSNLRWCTNKENLNFSLARENMSKASKGKPKSAEHRAKMSKTKMGSKHTDVHRAKISNALIERNPNSLTQKWKRASEAGDYTYSRGAFNRIYKDTTHKDHARVRALAKKYTI